MQQKFGNSVMRWLINSPLGALMGEGMAVITVTGRKTGRLISTPINVARKEDRFTTTSTRDRTWWRNLRGGAAAALRTGGKDYRVTAIVFESDEDVKRTLGEYCRNYPRVARFLKVRLHEDGNPEETSLAAAAGERVVIELKPLV